MHILILILTLALLTDMQTGKVPRFLTGVGMIFSQLWVIREYSISAALCAFASACLLCILLYPLFMIGALGAGDIKLLMLFPNFWMLSESLKLIFMCFILAAVMGLIKLLFSRKLASRLRYFFSYMKRVEAEGRILLYEGFSGGASAGIISDSPDSDRLSSFCGLGGMRCFRQSAGLASYQIHFTLPVFIVVTLRVGGFL